MLPNKELPLQSYPSQEAVEPNNPEAPLFAHLQALELVANSELITPELKTIILNYAAGLEDAELLAMAIDSWNRFKSNEEQSNPSIGISSHEMYFIFLVMHIVQSWGDPSKIGLHLFKLREYLEKFLGDTNPYLSLLNYDSIHKRIAEFSSQQKRDQRIEINIQESDKKRAKRFTILSDKSFDPKVKSGYALELTNFRGLDFGVVLTWVPESEYWITYLMISHAGHEPPRATSTFVIIKDAANPEEATAGFLSYIGMNLDLIKLPHGTELSRTNIKNALKRLNEQHYIYQLNM